MARRVVFIDDLDESHGAHPVRFGFRDKLYEIDLSDDHEAEFEELLSRYIEAGTEVTAPPAAGDRRRTAAKRRGREDLAAFRQWAKQQGIDVSDRGRIRADIIQQYDREQAAGRRTRHGSASTQPASPQREEGVRPVSGANNAG